MDNIGPTSLPQAQSKFLLELLQLPHVCPGSGLLGGFLNWHMSPNLHLSTQLGNPQHGPVEIFIIASSLKIATFNEIIHILFTWAPVERTEVHSMWAVIQEM